jgi:2-amino-4-hydroxy-6-hydroxymethyldihydropteridine diphosphokinase
VKAFVGLGSNVGDRLEHLRRAVAELQTSDGIEVVATSSVYETDPVGPPQPDFLNAVVEIDTSLAAAELLSRLKAIEQTVGRVARERWGPREVDLDLLLYGDETIDTDDLTVPHPEMYKRAFVVVPLRELDPSLAKEIDSTGVRYAHPPNGLS